MDDPVSGNTVTFTQADSRAELQSGETLAVLLGKIKKWLASLGSAAFTESSAYASAAHNQAWSTITDKPSTYTPTAHATSHKTGGADALAPGDIGAASGSVKTATLTVAGWSGLSQSVSVVGVTATNRVDVSAAPTSAAAYAKAKVLCTAQANGALTFTCGKVPDTDLTINIGILNL